MNNMLKRRIATQTTLDDWRGTERSWRSSEHGTCAHLFASHMRNMGYVTPTIPDFENMRDALREMQAMGWNNLTEMLDSLLERRPSVGFMRLGDVALAPGEGPFDAILICAGPLKVFGWHETRDDLVVMDVDLNTLIGAWAV